MTKFEETGADRKGRPRRRSGNSPTYREVFGRTGNPGCRPSCEVLEREDRIREREVEKNLGDPVAHLGVNRLRAFGRLRLRVHAGLLAKDLGRVVELCLEGVQDADGSDRDQRLHVSRAGVEKGGARQ